ncbi:MAG: preprotein translocase subunit SecG [Chitinophagales bacterium]
MYAFIIILIIIIGILLCAVVLIQNPKGGGVNASFSGTSQQIFGAGRSTDVVEKTTWTLASMLLLLSLLSAFFINHSAVAASAKKGAQPATEKTELEKRLNETGGFNAVAPAPQQPQQQPQQQPAPTGKP